MRITNFWRHIESMYSYFQEPSDPLNVSPKKDDKIDIDLGTDLIAVWRVNLFLFKKLFFTKFLKVMLNYECSFFNKKKYFEL